MVALLTLEWIRLTKYADTATNCETDIAFLVPAGALLATSPAYEVTLSSIAGLVALTLSDWSSADMIAQALRTGKAEVV